MDSSAKQATDQSRIVVGQPLRLFNSLGRQLQEFHPIVPGSVRLYTCGPTVYNYAHIGNLRAYLFTDTLRRTLQWKGYDVVHAMNITDVGHLTSDEDDGEDKMELASASAAKSPWELAAYYTAEFRKDLERLNIFEPSLFCLATDHIAEMIDFADVLEARGYAYVIDDGLYFDISRVPDYGRLALLDLEGQIGGARIGPTASKRNAADFALWRRSPKGKRRLMEWDSPWGPGAPGWHLECSVMSLKYLARRVDIHTGGVDHRQVHHCNEIAQNQGFLGDESGGVNYWLHNEFLTLEESKMSKSSGDFIRLVSLIDQGIHPTSYRYFTLMATYGKQLQFSWSAVTAAQSGLHRLVQQVAALKTRASSMDWHRRVAEVKFGRGASMLPVREVLHQDLPDRCKDAIESADQALSDNLNTPRALALLGSLVADSSIAPDAALRTIADLDLVLGLGLITTSPDDLLIRSEVSLDDAEVEALVAERQAARNRRDFRRADEIRNTLLEQGIVLKDTAGGTTWEKAVKAKVTSRPHA